MPVFIEVDELELFCEDSSCDDANKYSVRECSNLIYCLKSNGFIFSHELEDKFSEICNLARSDDDVLNAIGVDATMIDCQKNL